MDPFTATGAAASIIQLVETIGKAIQYLSDIKNEKKERTRLSRELGTLYNLLLDLEEKLDDSNEKDPWMDGLRSLALPHGPIDQLNEAMAKILKKIEPKSGLSGLKGTFLWPFNRKEVEEILGQIERQKSTINYALQGDQMNLQKAIKADTGQIPDIVSGLQSINLGVNNMENQRRGASKFLVLSRYPCKAGKAFACQRAYQYSRSIRSDSYSTKFYPSAMGVLKGSYCYSLHISNHCR